MTLASFAAALLFAAVAMSAAMSLATRIERRTGNSGWIDVVWTFGLGATGIAGALLPFGDGPLARRLGFWLRRSSRHGLYGSACISPDARQGFPMILAMPA